MPCNTNFNPLLCPINCDLNGFFNNGSMNVMPVMQSQGNANWSAAFTTFINYMWVKYNSPGPKGGCAWFSNRYNHWTSQLPNITNTYQISLKTAKIQWAKAQHKACQCNGPL